MSFSPRSTEDVVNNVDKFLVIPAGAGTTDRRAVNMGSTTRLYISLEDSAM